jgi:hypothetical protein
MNRYFVALIALSLLAGCATAPSPPLAADDPASPSAPEAPVHAIRNPLRADGLSKKTRQLLAQAAKEQQQAEQSGPDAGEQKGEEMKNMPNVQPPQEQMPGMQMPQGRSQPLPIPNK